MWGAETFEGPVVWVGRSVAQTHAFISTRVLQAGIRFLTEHPGVAVVAPTGIRAVLRVRLTDAVPRTKAEQRRGLAELDPNRHAEPQAQLAQLRVSVMQSDEIMMTRVRPPGLDTLAFVHVAGGEKAIRGLRGDGAAFKVCSRHVEEPDAVGLQALVSRHLQSVSALEPKRANLREAERRPGRFQRPPWAPPALRGPATDVSPESPVHTNNTLFRAPLQGGLAAANRLALNRVQGDDDEHQGKT